MEGAKLDERDGYTIVHVACRFENDKRTFRLVFDRDRKVAGMFVETAPAPWSAPSYAHSDAFEEREVLVGKAPALPGTLSVPKASQGKRLPAIILVHGSG